MEKNVYLVLTDLHYAPKKDNRLNYLQEVLEILDQVIAKAQCYRERGYTPSLIFLGDVVDGSMSSVEAAMTCQDLFKFLATQFKAMYCVLGNHEANNVTSNPFWYFVSSLDDPDLATLSRALQPKSIAPCLTVPAVVRDGEVCFYFNHYGVPPKVPSGCSVPIGLFHQNVGSNDICKMWGTFEDVEDAAYVQAYRYAYFGHMHMAFGKYHLNSSGTCIGEWLGTCVGTNVSEVETLSSEFNMPAVLVENGIFIAVEDNTLFRKDPKDVIDYTRLNAVRNTKEMVAKTKGEASACISADTLYDRVLIASDSLNLSSLLELLCEGYDRVRYQYKTGLEEFVLSDNPDDNEEENMVV